MSDWLKAAVPALGSVAAAAASALCCAGPILAVSVGISGAGLAATFEPWRPYFLGATTFFIVLGFVTLDREERKACEPGRPCASVHVRRSMRITLWIATGLAAILATFPRWQTILL